MLCCNQNAISFILKGVSSVSFELRWLPYSSCFSSINNGLLFTFSCKNWPPGFPNARAGQTHTDYRPDQRSHSGASLRVIHAHPFFTLWSSGRKTLFEEVIQCSSVSSYLNYSYHDHRNCFGKYLVEYFFFNFHFDEQIIVFTEYPSEAATTDFGCTHNHLPSTNPDPVTCTPMSYQHQL